MHTRRHQRNLVQSCPHTFSQGAQKTEVKELSTRVDSKAKMSCILRSSLSKKRTKHKEGWAAGNRGHPLCPRAGHECHLEVMLLHGKNSREKEAPGTG